jgi:MFS family permease
MTESSPPSPQPQADGARSLLRQRAYVLFWVSRFIDNLGVQAQSVTIAWQVYALARRGSSVAEAAFAVGMIGLAYFLPVFALTLLAGDTADRHDRRRIMIVCVAVEIACIAALVGLTFSHRAALWPIFAVAVVSGAARAFFAPASTALGPTLVPRELLPRAIAWNSLAWQGAAIAGPALGGLLCAISPGFSYAVAGGLYLVALICLWLLKAPPPPARPTASRTALIREGLSYVWTNKIVLGAISLDLFAVLLGGATALLPVFARDVLKVGAEGFGILRAGPALGAAAVAVWLAAQPVRRHAGVAMFAGVAIFGLATLVFAVSRSMAVSVAALAVLGGADMISVYVRQTLIQIVTPDAMRGRVAAVSGLFIGASNELGEFETGVVARLLGPVGAAVFGGVGALIVTGVWARLFPALRKADRLV